ncbi:MAG: hypothetical protein KGL53_12275 [Elusimicrobia bacterium]|nr:hypothetical protein [Elusimicrobiota bacterium]
MEPEVEAARPIPTGDELLAEARAAAPAKPPYPELVAVKLTLDQASFLWVRLYEKTQRPSRYRPETLKKDYLTLAPALLEVIWERLEDLTPTTPTIMCRRSVQFLNRSLTLRVRMHEAKFLLRILKNHRHDKWRRDNRERELFCPLEVAEIAEEGGEHGDNSDGVRRAILKQARYEKPDTQAHRAMLKKALKELPRRLKIPARDVRNLLDAILEADGNVSKAARLLGQPQRKTARRIQRILAHLERRGFSA